MYSILVCDDEKDIVSALKIYLMADGYQVFEAYNGKEALEVLKEQDIHLVLMDIMMPEMDGIAAMVKIRETSNVPVILLTAKSEDTDKVSNHSSDAICSSEAELSEKMFSRSAGSNLTTAAKRCRLTAKRFL